MAQERKSIVDKTLLEAEEIEKAFQANAEEILKHTMGSEIEEMVKESLEGSIGLTEDEDEELEVSDELVDIDAEEGGDLDDLDLDLDDESDDEDNEEDLEDIDLELDVDDEELDMDLGDEDVETIDLTGAEDSDVITVFKKMGPDDEIEVVQDGDVIDIKDTETGAEYRVDLSGAEHGMEDMDMDLDMDLDMDMDMEPEMEDMEEQVVYEIEITEDDDMLEGDYMYSMDDDMVEGDYMYSMDDDMLEGDAMDDDMLEGDAMDDEMEEGREPKTLGKAAKHPNRKSSNIGDNRRKMRESIKNNSKLIKENKVLKNKFNNIVSENEELKADYNKLVDALKGFRNKLNEVAVFNSNLTYAVRLFTENSTTKEEKVDIVKRFDEAKTLKESKMVYSQLKKEVSKKAPIKESIDNKVNETKGSGSKAEISESKVYVHPELEKMKKLWDFNYKY